MNIAVLIKLAPVALALIAGVWGYIERQGRQLAELEAAQQRDRADANAAVVARMQADAANNARIVTDYAAEIARLQEAERDLRNAIALAPTSNACGASGPIRVLLDGVRREAGQARDGRSPAAR